MVKKKLGFDIILLGAPASGKDTQAKLLEQKFVLKPVESGKYFRSLAKKQTQTGIKLANTFAKGKPSPVSMVKEFLTANLRFEPKNGNFIFVGNPRLKPEAIFLTHELASRSRDFLVLYLNLPESEIWKRSTKRGRDYQDLHYVKARINYHKRQVSKTIKYFKRLEKLVRVNGNQPIKTVNKDILKAINDYKKSRTAK